MSGKKTLDLCLLREGVKGRVKTRKLQNDINAVSEVIAWVSKQHCKPEDVHIIMEATGVYHESLAYGLHKAGGRISLANPHRTREFARGMGTLTKNDRVDALAMALLKYRNHGFPHQKKSAISVHFFADVMHL